MSELPLATPDLPSLSAAQGAFSRARMLRSVGLSLLVNALCPFLLYHFLEPHFPHGSLRPLLFSTIFPVAGFGFGIARKRSVDAIALIAIFELTISIVSTLAASNVTWALVVRSLPFTAMLFIVSALIGRPIIYYIARQFIKGGAPQRLTGFEAIVAVDKKRTFIIATLVWGVALLLISAVHIAFALWLKPAQYLLFSPIVAVSMNMILLVWSIRFVAKRLLGHLRAA